MIFFKTKIKQNKIQKAKKAYGLGVHQGDVKKLIS